MDERQLYVVMGLPCSGKSSYILSTFKDLPRETTEFFDEKKLCNLGRIIRYLKAAAWEKKVVVVVEGVFSNFRDRRKIVEWAYDNDYLPRCVVVDTELDTCLRRNKARKKEDRVTPGSIRKACAEMTIPSTFDGFISVKREYGNGEEIVPASRCS